MQREFTADAAHELRTPLTILRSRIDTLVDRGISKALHQDIEGMARIVSQLLDIAELETLSIDPQEKADLHAICAEVAEFAAPLALAQGKDIALERQRSVGVGPRQCGDAVARDPQSGRECDQPFAAGDDGGDRGRGRAASVRVLDEGPGIKDDERELIFQRFWRRDRRRAGSAGLGLSIVQRIADAHAADLSVENRPTGGAQFSLRFARIG